MKAFNGERLKEARYFRSYSITELSSILGVSKQMVSKYENGKSEPPAETLFRIVKELGFPLNFYFGKDSSVPKKSETFYRSRFTATQKQKSPTESLKKLAYFYRSFLEDYLDFPLLEVDKDFLKEISILHEKKDIEQIAQNLREYWGLGSKPIANMVNLLERKGFLVCDIPHTMDKVDAFGGMEKFKEEMYYIIFLENKETDFFRRQFSSAHELGHWILHSGIINPQDLEPIEYRNMEQEANDFASAFLLPSEEFRTDVDSDNLTLQYILSLRNKWNVSMSALLMRAKKLNIISEERYIKFQKQINYKKWRKKEPHSEDFEIKHPQSLREGTELLVSEKLIDKTDIPLMIENKFDRTYPNLLIEDVAGLPRGYINSGETEQIIKIKV